MNDWNDSCPSCGTLSQYTGAEKAIFNLNDEMGDHTFSCDGNENHGSGRCGASLELKLIVSGVTKGDQGISVECAIKVR